MNSNNFVSMKGILKMIIIYTSKETDYQYNDFIETIFDGFKDVFNGSKIIPK